MKWPGFAAATVCLIAMTIPVACDRDRGSVPPLPTPGSDSTHSTADKPRPTTQELLTGSRRVIRLGVVPISVRAPDSWEVKTYGDAEFVTFLEGWAPHDNIKIQLTRMPAVTPESIALTESGARKEMEANPDSIKVVNLREAGGVKIFERQSVGRRNDLPIMDADGKPKVGPDNQMLTSPQVTYRWSVSVFVPAGKMYDVFELIFSNLTETEFNADKSFLREIVDSIRYDETARDPSLLEAPKPKDTDRPAH